MYVSRSQQDTIDWARDWARVLQKGDVVSLVGDLGAGKTVFVKGVALALGITRKITSPTFVLCNSYCGDLTLHHIDAYRLYNTPIQETGIQELLDDEDSIAVVEWAQHIGCVPTYVVTIDRGRSVDDRLINIACVDACT